MFFFLIICILCYLLHVRISYEFIEICCTVIVVRIFTRLYKISKQENASNVSLPYVFICRV